jgi:preprotein translocase subunit SecY
LLQSLRNIFQIPELRRRVLLTLALLYVFRLGTFIPLPGIDSRGLQQLFQGIKEQAGGAAGKLGGWFSAFTGGALERAGIFALGIMPYITSSIIFQMLVHVVPALERLQKEGQSGQRKINEYSRYTTVLICLIQGTTLVKGLIALDHQRLAGNPSAAPLVPDPGFWSFQFPCIMSMMAGAVFVMWLGEQITEFGIGNGASLLIMGGIVADIPRAIALIGQNFSLVPSEGEVGPMKVGILLLLYLGIVVGVVFITQGQRRIPMQQARQVRGMRMTMGQRTYLPLRVNQAGVIPVIFASALLAFPIAITQAVTRNPNSMNWFQEASFVYIVPYVGLIFFFSYFYTAMVFNPQEWSDNLKQYGSFIPGIRPGPRTAEYLERIMNRVTLAGAAFLAAISIIPPIFANIMEMDRFVMSFLGGTGLLIVVGVALDMVQKIESHLLMRHYEGFMKKGRIRGRFR